MVKGGKSVTTGDEVRNTSAAEKKRKRAALRMREAMDFNP